MDLTMQACKIIDEIDNKIRHLEAANFEAKCVIMTNDQRIILEQLFSINTVSYTEPMKLRGLLIITNNAVKEIQIGV